MNKQYGYQVEQNRLEFDATILQKTILPNQLFGLILDQTYFYPTGGGQEHDTGSIANAKVINVYKHPKEPFLIHEVDNDIPIGPVHASIDGERRMRHMQHHTAQHLLTYCFSHLAGFETVSAHINGFSPSTLDLDIPQIDGALATQTENLANSIIFENRQVRSFFISHDQLRLYPLRKNPGHHEQIRIVEIDGLDYSECGGTHVSQTGTIGTIKITKIERLNKKVRIHFCAGWQALMVFQTYFKCLNELALRISIQPTEIPEAYSRLEEQVSNLKQKYETAQLKILDLESNALIQKAEFFRGKTQMIRLITAEYLGRSTAELRVLSTLLRKQSGSIVFLTEWGEEKVSMILACASDTKVSANSILTKIIKSFNGRGGGDDQIAQGGGIISYEEFKNLSNLLRQILTEEI